MYLLGTQALADYTSGRRSTISAWYNDVKSRASVFTSVISFGKIQNQIEYLPVSAREVWRRRLRLATIHFEGLRVVLPVDLFITATWAEIRADDLVTLEEGKEVSVGEDDLLVVATAIARNLTLVDTEIPPYYEALSRRQGLRFERALSPLSTAPA